MPRRPPPGRPSEYEVLAWIRANNAGPAAAAKQFPTVSINTIKTWQKRARDDGRIPRDNLTVLRPPEEPPEPPDLVAVAASLDLRTLARLAIGQRLARLAAPINPDIESIADSARIVASVADRVGVFEGLEPVRELDPTTEEGRTALRAAWEAFPPEVREMLRSMAS